MEVQLGAVKEDHQLSPMVAKEVLMEMVDKKIPRIEAMEVVFIKP